MSKPISFETSSAITGGGICFELSPEHFPGRGRVSGLPYALQSELGSIDASEALPGGATKVDDSYSLKRYVGQKFVMRGDE